MNISETVPIDDIQPHPANARRGNVQAIAESIRDNGWHGVVVCQVSTKRILVGKHRWEALKVLGAVEVPVQWRDVDDIEAMRIIIADNRASDLATYDDKQLLQNLRDIGSGQGTLFDDDAIETLTVRVEGVPLSVPHEFTGGYADEGEEEDARAKAAERAGREMKDVVLAMKPDQYADFIKDVKVLQKKWDLTGVIATVIAAVHGAATAQVEMNDQELKMAKMRKWLKELEWAVPHTSRADFLECFVD